MEESNVVEERKESEKKSLLFRGPTVVAALVCFVSGVFSAATGLIALVAPSDVQGTLLVNLAGGQPISSGLLDLTGFVMISLGIVYFVSGFLLWSVKLWIKGIYLGIMVSIIGTVVSGLATTFAPGAAAAGMVINILIITLLATETWEESRGLE